MNRTGRLAIGDRVRIIDEESPYYGKSGVVKHVTQRDLDILGKPRGRVTTFQIELDSGELVGISDHPRAVRLQIKKM